MAFEGFHDSGEGISRQEGPGGLERTAAMNPMNRREFIHLAAAATTGMAMEGGSACPQEAVSTHGQPLASEVTFETLTCETFVYGSTPGGIAAAVEAARRGERVILACPKSNPGGMAASGLCTTDAVRRHLFGGLVHEFTGRIREHYQKTLGENHPDWLLCQDGWFYEPSVAEQCFRDLLAEEENITWVKERWLSGVRIEGRQIISVRLEGDSNQLYEVSARTFIDATYEGDLAAKAGVPCRVGREGRDEFGESKAGIHYMNWRTGEEIVTPQSGEASLGIQAYCARSILTDDPQHRIPIAEPASYEQHGQDYLPLIDDFRTGRVTTINQILPLKKMPNGRYEVNGNIEALTSPNCPGVSWEYPTADRYMRQALDRFHIEHVAGLVYFLQTDSHVPGGIQLRAKEFGLHDQEFIKNGHWPWQIYVRQARRIEGRAILTQHSFTVDSSTGRTPRVQDAIAMGEHSFDVHPCHDRRWMAEGFMEGVLWYPRKAEGPAQPGQIPYGAMLPKNLDNLLVPVAMSSTHIAMSVLRMEPVWMTTGQVAGLAAAMAHQTHTSVSEVDPEILAKTLGIMTEPPKEG